jgi:hypothetical protein
VRWKVETLAPLDVVLLSFDSLGMRTVHFPIEAGHRGYAAQLALVDFQCDSRALSSGMGSAFIGDQQCVSLVLLTPDSHAQK